jgi:hypothetical protein
VSKRFGLRQSPARRGAIVNIASTNAFIPATGRL